MSSFPHVYVSAPDSGEWLCFSSFEEVFIANHLREVKEVVSAAESASKEGKFVAGFVGYEAAEVFDSAQQTHKPNGVTPLAWFVVSDSPPEKMELPMPDSHFCGKWRPSIKRLDYISAVRQIAEKIAAGDVYQVNLTYPLRAKFAGCPLSFFAGIGARQPSPWRFFAETEEWAVCSASPECFFEHQEGVLRSIPMKGTRRAEVGAAARLAASVKDRAENLMIVDMLRNDMSKLRNAENVRAEALLEVSEYPTVTQMTSTVACDTNAGLGDILAALFPCASVTGAPKIAAMQTIAKLEKEPRGVYCGACGWIGEGRARFNVAIRTAVVNKAEGVVEYSVGSGIVADSSAASEWEECRTKAMILHSESPPYLIETMRVGSDGGVPLLSRHVMRMGKSARYFGIPFNRREVVDKVRENASPESVLRLCLRADGEVTAETKPLPSSHKPRALLSSCHVNSQNILLRHKTSQRRDYELALSTARKQGFDDAVLQNERGEITETCIANIALEINGKLKTPALTSGLLPGTLRAELLDNKKMREAVLYPKDMQRAEKVFRLNAVRGMEEMTVEEGD